MKLFQTYLIWTVLSLPAFGAVYLYITDTWSYGKTLAMTGDVSIWLLILVLAIRPLVRFIPQFKLGRFLMKHRRAFGVAVFAYASLHTLIYLTYRADITRVLSEAIEFDLLAGWIALLVFIPLAYTSRNSSVRSLGKRWVKLHRWIYPAAILVTLHWVLSAFDPKAAYIHVAIILILLALRLKHIKPR